jgi:hypothetical protein
MAENSTATPITAGEVEQWLLDNADKKGTEDFNLMVSEYDRLLGTQGTTPPPNLPTTPQPEELGFFEGIGEAITGERRATDLSRTLPSYQTMPEFRGIRNFFSIPQFKTALGTIMGSPVEMADVIKTQYPQIRVRYDEKGNPILRSAVDNKEYVIEPGMELSDIPRAGAAAAMFALTKGRGLLGTMAQGAGTQTAYEGVQSTLGGEFGVPEVVTAGVIPGAFYTVGASAQALKPYFQAIFPRLFNSSKAPASVITNPNLSAQETAELARKAAEGNTTAMRLLAEDAAPDPKTLAAAERLGIAQFLQPDHVTTNQSFRELSQLLKSQSGSAMRREEMQGLQQVGERAFQLVDTLGGTPDLSTLNATVRNNMRQTLDDLHTAVDTGWTRLRDLVKPSTPVSPNNVINQIEARAAELGAGGENFLSPLEKTILSALRRSNATTPEELPTFGLLDQMRRLAGRATRGEGPHADEERGLAMKLYEALVADVGDAAEDVVGKQGRDLFTTVSATGRLENSVRGDITALFGRNVDKSMVSNLTSAVKLLSSGDADKFVNLIQAVPRDMRREVAVSALTTAFGRATQNGQLNFGAYTKWYEGLLRNRTAYRTLIGNLPRGAQKQFSDLYRVSRGIMMSTREFSNNGKSLQAGFRDADTAMQRLYGVAQRAAVGIPVEAAASALGFPGMGVASGVTSALVGGAKKPAVMQAVDAMVLSPQFRQMVVDVGTAKEVEAARALARTSAFRRFANAIKLPMNESQAYVLGIFQSGAQANVPEEALTEPEPTAPPQARVLPPAPSTRGLPGITSPMPGAPQGAPAAAAPTPPPGPVAQGAAGPSSREMLQDLFPFDATLRAG